MSSTVLELIAADYADRLRVGKVNSDERPELAQRYGVMSVPTILVFSQGELRQRLVGARSRSRLLEELAGVLNP
jgi:thioredoxin 1